MQLLATKPLSSKKLSTTDSLIVRSGGINLFCGHLEVLIYHHWIFFFLDKFKLKLLFVTYSILRERINVAILKPRVLLKCFRTSDGR